MTKKAAKKTTSKKVSKALNKPCLESHKSVRVARISTPPQPHENEDGSVVFKLAYVGEDHKYHEDLCSKEVFLMAEGDWEDGEVPNGLDSQSSRCQFVVVKENGGQVKAVHSLPKTFYSSRRVAPIDNQEIEELKLKIDQVTGSIEVMLVPPGVSQQVVRSILNALDNVEGVDPGDFIGDVFRVTGVAGREVTGTVSSKAREKVAKDNRRLASL